MTLRADTFLKISLAVIASLLMVFFVFCLALTQPRFGTPFANWALGIWGPEGATLESAHLKFPALTTLVARQVDIPDRVKAEGVEARLNPFGFLPFISWVSELEAEKGVLTIGKTDKGAAGGRVNLSRYRKLVDDIRLTNMDVQIFREEGAKSAHIIEANGSLRSGDLNVSATGAGSTLDFSGSADASSLSELTGELHVTGDNVADIADLFGLAAPDTPPFDIVMTLQIRPDFVTMDVLPQTRIGDSDIDGKIDVTLGGDTPFIEADLHSALLDANDLGIVFGIPIGVGGGETVGSEQKRAREAYEQSDRLIPNVVIDFSRLDAVDGTIRFDAEQVQDSVFDVSRLELAFQIKGRVVQAEKLLADFQQGSLIAYATIDGTRSPAVTTVEGNLSNVLLSDLALDPYARGTGEGRFSFQMTGDGFREAASSLDGRISVWSTDADILALAIEGAALDVGEALTVLGENPDDRTYTRARCAVLAMDYDSGVGRFSPAVIDTDDSLVLIKGDIDLSTEAIRLSVRSQAKDVSFGTLIGNLGIGGTLRNPEINPLSLKTVTQFGIAGILGSFSGGLAALPFIEPGLAEDAPCVALLARAEAASLP